MNWLDIVLLVLLTLSALNGLAQGLIKAVMALAGIIAGVLLAGQLYEPFSEVFGFLKNESAADIIAFLIILIGVVVVAAILATLLTKAVSVTLLGWVNRLGGAVFGLLVGTIFLSALLATWVKFFETDVVTESLVASFLLDKFPLVLGLLPSNFDSIKDFFN